MSQQVNLNDRFAVFVMNERAGQTADPPVLVSCGDPLLLGTLSTPR